MYLILVIPILLYIQCMIQCAIIKPRLVIVLIWIAHGWVVRVVFVLDTER